MFQGILGIISGLSDLNQPILTDNHNFFWQKKMKHACLKWLEIHFECWPQMDINSLKLSTMVGENFEMMLSSNGQKYHKKARFNRIYMLAKKIYIHDYEKTSEYQRGLSVCMSVHSLPRCLRIALWIFMKFSLNYAKCLFFQFLKICMFSIIVNYPGSM